jgi:hypothetical protein
MCDCGNPAWACRCEPHDDERTEGNTCMTPVLRANLLKASLHVRTLAAEMRDQVVIVPSDVGRAITELCAIIDIILMDINPYPNITDNVDPSAVRAFIAEQFEPERGCLSIVLEHNQDNFETSTLHVFKDGHPEWRDPNAMANTSEALAGHVCATHRSPRQFFQFSVRFASDKQPTTFLPFIRVRNRQ